MGSKPAERGRPPRAPRQLPLILAAAAFVGVVGDAAAAPQGQDDRQSGMSADGARYQIVRPTNWNGVLLIYAHGYAMRETPGPPAVAPPGLEASLLARGYALAASSYATPGWVLDRAPGDQLDAAARFTAAYGKPRLTLAWGSSMGGLVTAALAERPGAVDGALPMCGSVGGAVGMMNMALDGAFAFKTLLAPDDAAIRLVRTGDDMANGRSVAAALARARAMPAGRARVALAAVLAGIPPWTDPASPDPKPGDAAAAEAQAAKAFVMGVFLPRSDQERRAGGVFSWNEGVDYTAQLQRSGRRAEVEALYRAAGLDLGADLAALAAAPRIHADAGAVAWMKANFTPTGRLTVPVLTLHTIGDGATSPTLEQGYAGVVAAAGRAGDLRQLYVARAGHCNFTPAEMAVAVETLRDRLKHGRWGAVTPAALSARAASTGLGEAAFLDYRPTPFLRPCAGDRACAGQPAAAP